MNNNTNTVIWGVIIVIIFGIGAWLFFARAPSTNNNSTPGNTNIIIPGGTSSDTGSSNSGSSSIREIDVSGTSFSFSPSTISVRRGETVTIRFKNENGFHDFSIEGYNVRTPQIQAGQTAVVTFTAN